MDHDYKSHWTDAIDQIIEGKVISKVGVHDAVNSFGLHIANAFYFFVYASYHMLDLTCNNSSEYMVRL